MTESSGAISPTEELRALAAALESEGVSFRLGGVRGRDLTTFKIGGEFSLLIEPRNAEEAVASLRLARDLRLALKILGEGSNLLVPDRGVYEPVIRYRGRASEVFDAENGAAVEVEAGAPLMSLSRSLSDVGLSGLEFAGGIPGSLGGAVFMNAGAHGSSMQEIVEWVEVATASGVLRLSGSELAWRYRSSGLKDYIAKRLGEDCSWLIVRLRLRLSRADPEVTKGKRARYLSERRARQPLQAPCAGSIFKNPSVENPAWAVIERAGLKGACIGGASVSTMHANWIVNGDQKATADDVVQLIRRIKSEVFESQGVVLEEELVCW